MKKHQKEPDRWASAFAYASLQILERCVGEVGLDRPKIKAMLDATEFQTVAGPDQVRQGRERGHPGHGRAVAEERVRARVAQGLGHRGRRWCRSRPGRDGVSPDAAAGRRASGASPTGGIYALVALGLNLQYGLMRVLNVAHGEFLMLGAYVTFSLHTGWGVNPLLTLLVTGPTAFAVGLVLHRLLYAPLLAGERGGEPRVALAPALLRAPVRAPERGAPHLERRSQGLQLPRDPAAHGSAPSSPPTACSRPRSPSPSAWPSTSICAAA